MQRNRLFAYIVEDGVRNRARHDERETHSVEDGGNQSIRQTDRDNENGDEDEWDAGNTAYEGPAPALDETENETESSSAGDLTHSHVFWRTLTNYELGLVSYVISSTNSRKNAEFFFSVVGAERAKHIVKFLFESKMTTVKLCSHCAMDAELCLCDAVSESCITFLPLHEFKADVTAQFGLSVVRIHSEVRGGVDGEGPSFYGLLRDAIKHEKDEVFHFLCSWDGVPFRNSSQRIWVFGLSLLDLDDLERASIRNSTPLAIFCGDAEPTHFVHDRIFRWLLDGFSCPVYKHNTRFFFQVFSGTHDDPAMRKIYALKAHSSPGTCPFCYNQGTNTKINDMSTEDRETFGFGPPPVVNDGLKTPGVHSEYGYQFPMWKIPPDIFHIINEGIFKRILTESAGRDERKLFYGFQMLKISDFQLPTKYKFQLKDVSMLSGSERGSFFSTVVTASAMSRSLHNKGIQNAVVLLLNSIYRLQIEPRFDDQLIQRISRLTNALRDLIHAKASQFLTGPKIHMLIYHLLKGVSNYGPLGCYSTQSSEHLYHSMKRVLVSEVTNSFSSSCLRRSVQFLAMLSEVERRLEYSADPHIANIGLQFGLSQKVRRIVKETNPPQEATRYLKTEDSFCCSVFWWMGNRYASFTDQRHNDSFVMFSSPNSKCPQFGQIMTFCSNPNEVVTVILRPFDFQLNRSCNLPTHLGHLRADLRNEKLPNELVDNVIEALLESRNGGFVSGYKHTVALPINCILGYASLLRTRNETLILPLSTRPMLS